MEKVSSGMFVSVDYKGTLQDGQVFDTSEGRQPLEVQMGAGQLIKGFENALMGMALSEKKTFTLTPEEAYGPVDEERKHTFPLTDVPAEMDPQIGQTVGLTTQDGRQVPAKIVAVGDEGVTVDFNHPLAGESLTFEIEVVGISETPTQNAGCGCGCDCSDESSDSGCSSGESGCGCH
jgi:peptidylprolyl isomerase